DFVAHSAQVDGLERELADGLAGVRPGPGQVRLVSSVTGAWMEGTGLDAGYWYANLRREVRFADAVRVLAGEGFGTFIEVSPHPVLTGAVAETIEEAGGGAPVVTGTVEREDAGAERLVRALARAPVAGVGVGRGGQGDGELAAGCARALEARGAEAVVAEAGSDEATVLDREALAARIGEALAGGREIAGVLSLLAVEERPLPEHPVLSAG